MAKKLGAYKYMECSALTKDNLAETMDEDDAQAKKNARVVKNIAKSVMITDGKIVGDAK